MSFASIRPESVVAVTSPEAPETLTRPESVLTVAVVTSRTSIRPESRRPVIFTEDGTLTW